MIAAPGIDLGRHDDAKHLGHPATAADILSAIEAALERRDGRSRDLGGRAGTRAVGRAIEEILQ